ncbi:M20/M25/M40 family metallo-hydrolase [Spongiactinospora sp. TRM90649]|uniref:M20/M25/M40 family metallo-hydrolase n=1 Tax=Spongiactinospora sp. TRM90649 TaxID=3031114 RepID=UPI0023F8DD4E|nr:M20/M25/M40 family metallo-hydrolase [Spongiactinospora sp. TRM90649]MDF5751660.1 M20/M25/M40 family metallo-hydrolase [Spongiactinospora sp. TRM90649]
MKPVEEICADLIRFDTSNPGADERDAAEYVAALLAGMGLDPVLLEAEPRRTNVVTRIEGTEPGLPALLVQGHLDTVPADPSAWTVHPRGGEIRDGQVWGRGAVDMKNAVAMTLAATGRLLAAGARPRRDIVLAFVADEETGGVHGAGYLVNEHPELFEGCAACLGEVGGFNVASPPDGPPTFAISVADKGLRWYEIVQRGIAGHGSLAALDNPITGLADTVLRLAAATRTVAVPEPMRLLACELAGREVSEPADVLDVLTSGTGPFGRMLAAGMSTTVNVTRVGAGDKENVVPGEAWARVDCRYLPGQEDELDRRIRAEAGPSAEVRLLRRTPPVVSDHTGEWFDRMAEALRDELPGSRAAPYVFSGGTDNKWFGRLGMRTYGFTPMLLPSGYDYPAMFHGVDERVPVEALRFGERVMERLMCR